MQIYINIFYHTPLVFCILVTLVGSIKSVDFKRQAYAIVYAIIPIMNIYFAYLLLIGIMECWKEMRE